ncbi:hypothetical protein SCA03_69310 [Streptomyces cacaoi]|uniref:Transposase n=1 Tax=Streptomyces cacaoi TaxID=1898 RepID=A0A4Y3RF19_STRCI|nr:hypothetical protein SCA03_69310 [Streptomyces cacaoi]
MVAVVVETDRGWATLARPSGLTWDVSCRVLRPATPYEVRQFRALAALQQVKLRGMP